jgi:hypothetical protein
LNTCPGRVYITELTSYLIHTYEKNYRKVYVTQKVTLKKALSSVDVIFSVVPNLSVPILLGFGLLKLKLAVLSPEQFSVQ